MKVITIGRDPECNIVLDDNLISRRHAVIRLHGSGKIEIIDYSSNGTFVNGTRIVSNTPVKIRRKDAISFAHSKTLDWGQIPDISRKLRIFVLGGIAVLATVAIVVTVVSIVRSCRPAVGTDDIESYENVQQQPTHPGVGPDAKTDGNDPKQENTEGEGISQEEIKLAPDPRILNEVERKKREQIEKAEAKKKKEAEEKRKKEARKEAEDKDKDKDDKSDKNKRRLGRTN